MYRVNLIGGFASLGKTQQDLVSPNALALESLWGSASDSADWLNGHMTDIASIVTSLKAATDIARFLKDSELSLEKAEAKMKLADLVSALADAKVELAELQLSLAEKDEQIRSLQEQVELTHSVQWEEPFYWIVRDGEKDGPFCQQCYDKDSKLMRLHSHDRQFWQCATCNHGISGGYRLS
jgi:hypothetical protein